MTKKEGIDVRNLHAHVGSRASLNPRRKTDARLKERPHNHESYLFVFKKIKTRRSIVSSDCDTPITLLARLIRIWNTREDAIIKRRFL